MEAAAQRIIEKTAKDFTMERREVIDLFGETVVLEISEAKGRKPTKPNGYAALPGTGPEGERCRTCEHAVGTGNCSRTYYKCALMRTKWTSGPGTDILLRSPACRHWEKEK